MYTIYRFSCILALYLAMRYVASAAMLICIKRCIICSRSFMWDGGGGAIGRACPELLVRIICGGRAPFVNDASVPVWYVLMYFNRSSWKPRCDGWAGTMPRFGSSTRPVSSSAYNSIARSFASTCEFGLRGRWGEYATIDEALPSISSPLLSSLLLRSPEL